MGRAVPGRGGSPRGPGLAFPVRLIPALTVTIALLAGAPAVTGGEGVEGTAARAGPAPIALRAQAPGNAPETDAADGAAPAQLAIERDSFRVVFWPGAEGAARRTLDAALAPLPLPGIPGSFALPPSTIVLAPNRAVFDSVAGGRTPDWAAGVAIPSQRLIVLPTSRARGGMDDPVVTLRHEIAHLALNAHLDAIIPRWFDEGYATWVSGGWDERSGWQIRLALLRGQAPPLDSLTLAWPRGEGGARLAYLLSASAVNYLATSRGQLAFDHFIAAWRQLGSFDAAMRVTYQMTTTQFEREWRAMVRRRYGWLLAISQTAVFWLGTALLVLLLGSLRRRRNRERLEALRREEYMLPATAGPVRDGLDPDQDPG